MSIAAIMTYLRFDDMLMTEIRLLTCDIVCCQIRFYDDRRTYRNTIAALIQWD